MEVWNGPQFLKRDSEVEITRIVSTTTICFFMR